jgi:hypothetical protein
MGFRNFPNNIGYSRRRTGLIFILSGSFLLLTAGYLEAKPAKQENPKASEPAEMLITSQGFLAITEGLGAHRGSGLGIFRTASKR